MNGIVKVILEDISGGLQINDKILIWLLVCSSILKFKLGVMCESK